MAPQTITKDERPGNGRQSVRRILISGVFWRILVIEMILLVFSLAYRAFTQDVQAVDLFWYAVRILILVTIIIGFVTLSLRRFLNQRIIVPLEEISRANRHLDIDAPTVNPVHLPDDAPDEILQIVDTRQRMLESILNVSADRLKLVNFIRDTFGRYLSKKVVDEILASPDGQKLGGRRETVTILMADLRGFTRIADTYDAEQTMALLNRFFGDMARIITSYDGMIDEFLGDGILTIFGVPERHPDDPARAVACALEMQNRLVRLNAEIAQEGYPSLSMGIGIHTGQVIVGNIGSEIRSKYGIVGNSVNIAARIESITTAGQIYISDDTFRLIESPLSVTGPETVMMKGLTRPLVCYAVKGIGAPYDITFDIQEKDETPAEINLALTCWLVADKKVIEPGMQGQTRCVTESGLTITLEQPVPNHSDVKVQLDFCTEAHCFNAVYAKIIASETQGHYTLHRLRITSIDPKDRELLLQWSKAAS